MRTIASRLAWLRAEHDLSARDFAAALAEVDYEVSHVAVLGYEKEGGTKKIPGEYLAAVCRRFAVGPEWILTGEGQRERIQPTTKETAFDRVAQIVGRVLAGEGVPELQIRETGLAPPEGGGEEEVA